MADALYTSFLLQLLFQNQFLILLKNNLMYQQLNGLEAACRNSVTNPRFPYIPWYLSNIFCANVWRAIPIVAPSPTIAVWAL